MPEEREGHKKRIKNLRQYKDMPAEEFEGVYESILDGTLRSSTYEKRIAEELEKFTLDYDISDLKINDHALLRALIQASISLEDYEQIAYKLQRSMYSSEENSDDVYTKLDKITRIMNALRKDISSMQEDLKITRKVRKGDREESVAIYIDNLKSRAKTFFESKVSRIFCPDCRMLLATIWVLHPESPNNKFWIYCKRCDKRHIITYPELVEKGLKNIDNIPEF